MAFNFKCCGCLWPGARVRMHLFTMVVIHPKNNRCFGHQCFKKTDISLLPDLRRTTSYYATATTTTAVSQLTIQSQHRRKVLAVGHTGGISHTRFPQVGPEGSRGDDRPVHGGYLPVVCRQGGRHQDPPRDSQDKGNDLCCHVAHFFSVAWRSGLGRDRTEIFPSEVTQRGGGRVGPGQVRQRRLLLHLPSIYA